MRPMTISLTLRAMTPDAVPAEAPDSRLLASLQQRTAYALGGRDDLGAGVGGHALTALALLVALVARLEAQRPQLVECALRARVPLPAIADALGLPDGEDVRVLYSRVVIERIGAGALTPAEGATLLGLLDDQAR